MADTTTISSWKFGSLVRKLRYKQYRGAGLKSVANLALLLILTLGLVSLAVAGVLGARADVDGVAIVAAGVAVSLLGWTIFPIAFAGGQVAVDPQLFAMYPIRRSTLGAGLLSAAFVSMPSAGAIVVAASMLSYAQSVAGAIVIGFAALVAVVSAVLSSQTVMVFFSGAIKRRSTKDFAAGIGALLAISLALIPQVLVSVFESGDNVDIARRMVGWVNSAMVWVPWGWAPSVFRAGADEQWARAAIFGVLALGWVAVLFRLWSGALSRSLVERPAKASAGRSKALVSDFQERLLGSEVAAMAARSRRELYRDSRQFMELAGWLPLIVISAVPGWDAIRSGSDELVLSSGLVGVAIGLTALNLFGFDGPAFGLDVLVDRDLGVALRGKLAARIQLGLAVVTVVALALAAFTGGWRFVPASIVFGMCGLLAELSIGAIVSVRYPFPVPPKAGTESMFYNPGCFNQFVRGVALIAAFVFTLPLIAPATFVSVEYNAVWGFALALFGLALAVLVYRSCEQRAERRLVAVAPEMFQVLSTVG